MSGTEVKPGAPDIQLTPPSGALEWAFWMNVFGGVAALFIGGVAWYAAADAWTVGAVALVTAIWAYLLWKSKSWSDALRPARSVPPPEFALIWHKGAWHLPGADVDGVTERLSDEQRFEPPWLFGVGASLLISIGLAGTFFGLTMGLMDAVPKLLEGKHDEAVNELLDGAKLAFLKSLAGIVLGTLWTLRMGELRALGRRAQAHLRHRLIETFPPLKPEQLLADGFLAQLHWQQAQAEQLSTLLKHLHENGAQRSKASAERHGELLGRLESQAKAIDTTVHAGAARHSELVGVLQGQRAEDAKSEAELIRLLKTIKGDSAQLAGDLVALRGGEEASVFALIGAVGGLNETLKTAADKVPERIGEASGRHLGRVMEPSFGEVTTAVKGLSSKGGEAISQTFKDNVGQQATELAEVMGRLTRALEQLPAAVENSGKHANQKLEDASAQGAETMTTAAAELSRGATESAVELRAALAEGQGLIGKLEQGGDALRGAFDAVAAPLRALPPQIASAGDGVQRAATAAVQSAHGIEAAGEHLKQQATAAGQALREGAEAAKVSLVEAATGAGAALERHAGEAGANLTGSSAKIAQDLDRGAAALGTATGTLNSAAAGAADALRQGGDQLSGSLTTARRELGEGFTAELQAIRGALATQLTAQSKSLEGAQAHHALMQQSAERAREQVQALGDQSALLIANVEQLRATCDGTVKALQDAAGQQQQGAGDAVKELLESVKVFSTALGESPGAVQAASLKVVASTEQVTAEAAQRVAEALSKGAETFEASMGRVERVGARLDQQGAALQISLSAAERSAGALAEHGEAMVGSASALKAGLVGVVQPLHDARASLEAVPAAVGAAVTAMETERDALTGLGASLSEQVALVREEERQLGRRAEELRGLTRALGGEIAKHVERISEAQEKVRDAWSMAMKGVDTTVTKQSEEMVKYAKKVEDAVGVGARLTNLNTSLGKLADDLEPLDQLPTQIKALQTSIDQLTRALAPEDR